MGGLKGLRGRDRDSRRSYRVNGSLLLPAKLLHAEGSPADASKNGAEAKPNGAVTKASKDIERRRTQARPVQTWPKEMEGN